MVFVKLILWIATEIRETRLNINKIRRGKMQNTYVLLDFLYEIQISNVRVLRQRCGTRQTGTHGCLRRTDGCRAKKLLYSTGAVRFSTRGWPSVMAICRIDGSVLTYNMRARCARCDVIDQLILSACGERRAKFVKNNHIQLNIFQHISLMENTFFL